MSAAYATNNVGEIVGIPSDQQVALLQILDAASSAISSGDHMAAADQLMTYRARIADLVSEGRVSARGGGRALQNAADNLIRSLTTGT